MGDNFENNKIPGKIVELYEDDKTEENVQIGFNHKSLGDIIYETLKHKIIYREIKPGERIIDKHLADEFGVSRSLVRQALTILEKEELVKVIPRSGFYVKEMTKQEVKELYDIRCILEGFATELAVPRIPDEEILNLERIFNEANKDLTKDKVETFIEADAELHKVIVNNCGNKLLINIINKYNNRYVFYRIVDLSGVPRAKEAYHEHLNIFKAVKDRDVDLAVNLMKKHIENAKNIILDNYEEYTFAKIITKGRVYI